MKVAGRLTGVGVYPYRDPNNPSRIIRRLRSETEVFKPESIKTLEDAPYTKRHPPEMVNPQNVGQYRKGHVSKPVLKEGAEYLTADIIIEDADAIEDVKSGVKQLSCGYLATIEDTPGVWQHPVSGEKFPYDDQQCDIAYNHVAGVPVGRQGPDKSLLLDRKEFFFQDGLDFDLPQGETTMKYKVTLMDGSIVEMEMDEKGHEKLAAEITKARETAQDHETHLSKIKKMADDCNDKVMAAEKKAAEAKDNLDKVSAQADSLKTEVDRLKKVHVDAADPKNLVKTAVGRALKVAVLNQLTDGKKISFEDSVEQTDAELMKLVILADASLDIPAGEKHADELKKFSDSLKEKSEVYLQAAYDAIERREKKTLQQAMDLGTFLIDTRELKGRQGKQEDGLNPELRTTAPSAARTKLKDANEPEPTGIIAKGITGSHAKDDDKAYRDKQENRFKDYRGAKSKGMKDTKERAVR